jgi:alpha-soluble NSF attachment protein
MRLKVAELSTLNAGGDLIAAIKIFEEIGDKYMENKLTAPSAKELYFKSCLLYLCNNVIIFKYLGFCWLWNSIRKIFR